MLEKNRTNTIKVIFHKTNISKILLNEIRNYFLDSEFEVIFQIRNKTAFLARNQGRRIIVTSTYSKKDTVLTLCQHNPVIFLAPKISMNKYRQLLNEGFYDVIPYMKQNFKMRFIKTLARTIKEYETIEKKHLISKGLYFANVIHELRSPLNSILGFTSMLFENETDAYKKNNLKTVLDSSKYMLNVINDTLDFTKLQSGKLEINPITFILKNTVEHISNIFNISRINKKIDFKYTFSDDCPIMIYGDEFRFTQILINILSNAFKFTEENGIIKVNCKYIDNKLVIGITDNGSGISYDKLDRIFLPFEQSSELIARTHGGTGLGLAITKELIEIMGGTINVISELQKGTTFTISLPFKKVDETPSLPSLDKNEDMVKRWISKMGSNDKLKSLILTAIRNLPKRIDSFSKAIKTLDHESIRFQIHKLKGFCGSYDLTELYEIFKTIDKEYKTTEVTKERLDEILHKIISIIEAIPDSYLEKAESTIVDNLEITSSNFNILYVDDLDENRNLFKYYLEKLNYQCDLAQNMTTAIELVKNNHYTMIILDLQMPDISGFDLLPLLKKMQSDAIFIAATGDADNYVVERIKLSSFDSYFLKPFNDDIISEQIDFVIKKKDYNNRSINVT